MLASGAYAKRPVPLSCGKTITTDTKLANDLIDCPEFGIVIGADDITLDLNGHTVDGTAGPCDPNCENSVGILNDGHDRVTIKGGSVREFSDGVVIAFSDDSHVRGVSSLDQRHFGIVVHESTDIRIERSSVVDTAFVAIFMFGSHDVRVEKNAMAHNGTDTVGNGIWAVESDGITIERNVIDDSHSAMQITDSDGERPNLIAHNKVVANDLGIELDNSEHSHVTDNHIAQSGIGILVFGSHNTITRNHIAGGVANPEGDDFGIGLFGGEGNQIARNQVRGTLLDGILVVAFEPDVPTLDTVIRDNRVHRAGVDGFSIATFGEGTVSGTLFEGNLATDSDDDGFDIRSPATTLTSNFASRNGDLGIEAVPGVIDDGGNKARGNGNPLQCVNVFCG